jgi:hypothetical protein
VAAVATLAGFPPDPEQQLLLDVSFGLDKHGRPLVFETVLIAPRQNLKTGFLKQRALGKLFVQDRPLVVWSAHEFDTSRRALLDLEAMIESAPSLRRRVRLTARGKVATHGAIPEITLEPRPGKQYGATLAFKTRTSGGGRGLSGDDLFVDEAFAAQADQMGAVMPIMLARPDSQVDFASSACRPESEYLWDLVQQGRAGGGRRMLFAEWCTPPPSEVCDAGDVCTHGRESTGCGCDKPEVIKLAHSAVTRGRIELQKITDLRRTMPPAEFGREIMGWHDEPDEDTTALSFDAWQKLEDLGSKAESVTGFGVEISLDRAWGSFGAAGPRDKKRAHIELVERRRGTGWMLARAEELDRDHGRPMFVIDGGGPAASLITEFEDAGLWVVVADTSDVAEAYAFLVDAVAQGGVSHGPQVELDQAVMAAKKRPVGDGKFALGRKASGGADITPLKCVELPLWAHLKFGEGLGPDDIGVYF